MTIVNVLMWFATFLNLAACALNVSQYLRGKRLNKELEDAIDLRKRAENLIPKVHIVHLIHEQPKVKVDVEIKDEEKEEKTEQEEQ